MQANGKLTNTAWADHVRGCSDLAKEIAIRMDIRDDPARQAMLATIIISADRHNIFLEPFAREIAEAQLADRDAEKGEGLSTSAIRPEAAAATNGLSNEGADRDTAAAVKADAQIQTAIRNPTEAQADGAKRTALLMGINAARDLLNKAGHVPPVTPKGLNAYIANKFKDPPKTELGQLDTEELERLTMLLAKKLDALREKQSKIDDI